MSGGGEKVHSVSTGAPLSNCCTVQWFATSNAGTNASCSHGNPVRLRLYIFARGIFIRFEWNQTLILFLWSTFS